MNFTSMQPISKKTNTKAVIGVSGRR
jgi:hypothetical protein